MANGLLKREWHRASGHVPPSEPKPSAVAQALAGCNPLWETPARLEIRLRHCSLHEVQSEFAHDPWLRNYLVSIWERAHGCGVVTTYPWNLTLAITNHCNARCAYCPIWLRSKGLLDIEKAPNLKGLLARTKVLLLTGGEPTVHPHFEEQFLQIQRIVDPRAFIALLTNGARLHRFRQTFAPNNIGFAISLNAATSATHQALMGLGPSAFARILETVRWLRDEKHQVDLSFVVVRGNLEELPAFIRLGEELGVSGLYVRTLNPGDYYYALLQENPNDFDLLPPYRHPQFARWLERAKAAIKEARVPVYANPEQWGVVLQSASLPAHVDWTAARQAYAAQPEVVRTKGDILPEGGPAPLLDGNPYQREPPFPCGYPWYATKILDTSLRLSPCGFMYRVHGYQQVGLSAAEDFSELWNSPAMIRLRETLQSGPLLPACRTCPTQL